MTGRMTFWKNAGGCIAKTAICWAKPALYLYGKAGHHFAEAEALLYLARVEAVDQERGSYPRARAHYKHSIELYDFMQNDIMKNAVLEEYQNFLKRTGYKGD